MPSLHWLGKEKVINHHLDIPFHTLNEEYRFAPNKDNQPNPVNENSSNKIIHADNLLALKSLLPEYEGRVKCIYIDPPYNTGNEGWVYNDNVSDPRFKKWLKAVVGKEGEDLTRHDKWLCMMYPRLVLLHKLLADDGAIFISIDDNEQASLKLMMDEIFGAGNFVADFIWNHRKSSQNDTDVSLSHNYTICFSKNRNRFRIRPMSIVESKFSNPDNDTRGSWVADPMDAPNIRQNLEYEIINPNTKEVFLPPKGRHWRFTKEKYEEALLSGRIIFGKTGKTKPQYKRFLFEAEKKGTNPFTIWSDIDTATDATKELMLVFDGEKLFDTPKPTGLVERIIQLASDSNSIILDSFAGSGTTAHAVLNLNKQDGGNRKFILIEMEDYAETITAERVKRVINGYKDTEGTGGSFSFYTLGETVLDDEGNLNTNLALPKIHSYIWFAETRQPYTQQATAAGYLGQCNNTGIYFYYEPHQITVLDDAYLVHVTVPCEQYIMYADVCLLSDKTLRKHNIIFKKIPRDISKL